MIVSGSVPGSAWFRLVLEGRNMDTLNMCFRVCIDVDMYMHCVFVFVHKICIDIYVPGPHVFHVCSVMVISEVYLQCFSQLLWVERPGREQWECTWMSAPARCVTFIGTLPQVPTSSR